MEVTISDLSLDLVEKICVIVLFAYIVTRTKYFAQVLGQQFDAKNRAFLILVCGAFSIFGTYVRIKLPSGAIANIRDLAPMFAGLVGGPIIGLGAGLIGGIHRYFLGGLTAIPCALATIIAGLAGGVIYKLRKGEFVAVWQATLFAAVMESLHMGLVLLIARPFSEALAVERQAYEMETASDFIVTIRDRGKPFDPSSVPPPDLEADLDKRRVGGLGIYFMRKLMDEVNYTTDADKGNELTMRKRLPK